MCVGFESLSVVGFHPPKVGSSLIEQAIKAASFALRGANCDVDTIDLVLFAGTYHDEMIREPAVAALLLDELSSTFTFPKHQPPLAFDVDNGACGFLTAVQIAASFLSTSAARRVLVTAGDGLRAQFVGEDFPLRSAACAAVVSRAVPKSNFMKLKLYSFPEHNDVFVVHGLWRPDVRVSPGEIPNHIVKIGASPELSDICVSLAERATRAFLADQPDKGLRPDAVVVSPWPLDLPLRLSRRVGIALAGGDASRATGAGWQTSAIAAALIRALQVLPNDQLRRWLLVNCGPGVTVICGILTIHPDGGSVIAPERDAFVWIPQRTP
jgi:3-oxoacyl-[acyl-carrier-protein] synthase-3